MNDKRGLLASRGLEGQPVKAVYFFPGEGDDDGLWTTHPLDERHRRWNSDDSTRSWVIRQLADAHANTVVMSYWSNILRASPMTIDPSTTWRGVLDAVESTNLVILPAIESGFDSEHHWEFADEFPEDPGSGLPAPGLIGRIGELVQLFAGREHLWAQLFDRDGEPRHAVNIIHACSAVISPEDTHPDATFAEAFDKVAAIVKERFRISVGFTIDAMRFPLYSPTPRNSGQLLEQTCSVLAIHGFASEVLGGPVIPGKTCSALDWRDCDPHDNNADNIEQLAEWKRTALSDWVATGVPVILDVSNGFDGRIVWRERGTGFWGDNLDYTDDRWRNWMSQLKGPGIKGVSFNTWNGYTEGYAAVPSAEHGTTVFTWLRDLLEPDPRDWSHMHYVNGAPTHRVYGAICEKWIALGADRGFGAPTSEELPSAAGRMQHFSDAKAIYWSPATGAHEVHGLIARAYRHAGADSSCLGLPTTDEETTNGVHISRFEHGLIMLQLKDTRAHINCW
jgi:hypothetical protein